MDIEFWVKYEKQLNWITRIYNKHNIFSLLQVFSVALNHEYLISIKDTDNKDKLFQNDCINIMINDWKLPGRCEIQIPESVSGIQIALNTYKYMCYSNTSILLIRQLPT